MSRLYITRTELYAFILPIIILLFTIILYVGMGNNNTKSADNLKELSNYEEPIIHTIINNSEENNDIINSDAIRDYDLRKIYDPLTEPTRRVQRHQIPGYQFKKMIDISSRGNPDNYSQLGLLISETGENKYLRLFGRQKYPRSNLWEYYTMISSGNDMIKIPVDVNKGELYDEDVVHVKTLDKDYKVELHDIDSPKYYPDIY
jgi:hypothetical protein